MQEGVQQAWTMAQLVLRKWTSHSALIGLHITEFSGVLKG